MKIRRGVTLLELLLVTAIMSMVLASVLSIFSTITGQWSGQVSRSQSLLTTNAAMDAMTKEIRQAISLQGNDGSKNNVFWMPANLDALGNYLPALLGNALKFVNGGRVHFYLSDTAGTASSGTVLWREYKGLTGPWVSDTAWSRFPGTPARGKYTGITSLTFATSGLPDNMARITMTVSVQEGSKTSTETVQRDVYLSNHN